MTQIAFLRKIELPTNGQIQEQIQKLGYDFQIFDDLERKLGDDGIECSINGYKTYFETYVNEANDLMSEQETKWIEPDLTNQDTAISFVWGADFSAGACVGLISVALIDLSGALVYYIDDQMKYTREMLIEDTPQFLAELKKQVKAPEFVKQNQKNNFAENDFWTMLKRIFK
ncbi:hypothetical protein B0A64_12055 [Flavobacterium araucananum]|uniref:SMI1/KNR4 family protein n=2 Tax=Flavobacterium araucananum TaxID=946678 RepID=A0A227P803_9FLAO|nr:hypothetical protein B0A64_12055 [Flavobacterium araucananum]